VAKQIQRLSGIIANSGVPGSQDLESVTSLGYITSFPIQSGNAISAINPLDNNIGAGLESNGTLLLSTNGSTASLAATNVTSGNCNLELPDATTETLAIAVTTGSAKYADTTGQIQILDLAWNYINDAAAQAGGIPVGGLYHTAGVVKLRLV
jgi:hypothetical protein